MKAITGVKYDSGKPAQETTYSIKNHPGGYDIYKDGKPLDANEVVRLLEQLPKSGNNLPNTGSA